MKTNLPGDFDQLAQAAIEDLATDAQLEALESAIMESSDGADVFRDMAESQAVAIAQSESPVKKGLPLVAKLVVFGSVAAAAAVVTLIGAGVLYFHFATGSSHQQQVASSPVDSVVGEPNDLVEQGVGELSMTPAVPEPSTSLLLLSGATLLLLKRRR